MMAQNHPLDKLTDYTLDLLCYEERERIARHLQHCATCREAVSEERAICADARKALLAVTEPSPTRLHQLAPAAPKRQRAILEILMRPALALGLVLLLFASGLHVYGVAPARMPVYQTATSVAVTATVTPTSTIQPSERDLRPVSWKQPLPNGVQPAGTPVASLPNVAHN